VAVDPYIVDGEVPTVEHVVPLPGMAIVPVTPPVGAGLIPGDASSVAPRGIAAPESVEPVPKPSGEVAPMLGVGVAIACAMAKSQTKSVGRTAAIREDLIRFLRFATASLRRARLSVNSVA